MSLAREANTDLGRSEDDVVAVEEWVACEQPPLIPAEAQHGDRVRSQVRGVREATTDIYRREVENIVRKNLGISEASISNADLITKTEVLPEYAKDSG